MDLNSRYAILLRHISLGMYAATEREEEEREGAGEGGVEDPRLLPVRRKA